MADHKIYIFAGGHKIAEGEGEVMAADGSLGSAFDTLKAKTGIAAKSMQEMVDAYNSIKLREKMAMWKKSRLPRKLKKALRKQITNLANIINKEE